MNLIIISLGLARQEKSALHFAHNSSLGLARQEVIALLLAQNSSLGPYQDWGIQSKIHCQLSTGPCIVNIWVCVDLAFKY